MEKNSRIHSLDGLRAISICLVIFSHIQMNVGNFGETYNLGNLGVRVFFVISGFLITRLLLQELDKTGEIALLKFYFRRTMRIFVPFYIFLAAMYGAMCLGLIPFTPNHTFLSALSYTINYSIQDTWDITHSWSLAVEEQFYLILPGVLVFLGARKTKLVLLLALLIAPISRLTYFFVYGETDFFWFTTAFHHNMDALSIGGLLSLFYQTLHSNKFYQMFLNSKLPLLLPIAILILNNQDDHPKFAISAGISLVNVLIALCLDWVVVNHESFVGKFLNSRPMVLIGMMSYSIYLWQQPFFNPNNKALFTTAPLNLVGMILISIISYYLIEKNTLRLRQFWETRFFGKKPAQILVGHQDLS